MPIVISGGKPALAEETSWRATHFGPPGGLDLTFLHASYGTIYSKQLWVYVVVNKRAKATARLPLKVYRKGDQGREDARDHPYGRLLMKPNPKTDAFTFWEWVSSTFDVYGEAMVLKVRGRGGVTELWPMHPANVRVEKVSPQRVRYVMASEPSVSFEEEDVVHFRSYNPANSARGLSPLEPLRQSLVNEDSARRAAEAFWRNGGRPSIALLHEKELGESAARRLAADFAAKHGGVDNFAKPLVLEEGMKPHVLSLNAEEAQYVESRKLNREEVCAAYDMPPPAVHILDRATFNNITEQFRSVYRDTMAPHLKKFESVLDMQLRPEFGDGDIYAEFLMDEVLRGSFEARQDAYRKADYMTIAEKRENENLPFIHGTDRIYINSASVPLDSVDEIIGLSPKLPIEAIRTLLGKTAKAHTLEDIDPNKLVDHLNGHKSFVLGQLTAAKQAGESLEQFRSRIKLLGGE